MCALWFRLTISRCKSLGWTVCSVVRCAERGQTDLDFYGLAMKLQEGNAATMAMEVAPCQSMMELRQNNSIVMARKVASPSAP